MGGRSEGIMGQKGFFDVERRLEAISAKGDPLETIKKIVRWENSRGFLNERPAAKHLDHRARCYIQTCAKGRATLLYSTKDLSLRARPA
jgi:hypothetical protein